MSRALVKTLIVRLIKRGEYLSAVVLADDAGISEKQFELLRVKAVMES